MTEDPPTPAPDPEETREDFDELKNQAKNLFFRAAWKVQKQVERFRESESGAKLQALLKVAHDRFVAARDSNTAARLKELASIARKNASTLSDAAAERLAAIYGESTGQKATPQQVKRAAVKMGVTTLVTAVAFTFLRRIPGINTHAVLAGLKKIAGNYGEELSRFFQEEPARQDGEQKPWPAEKAEEPPPESMI